MNKTVRFALSKEARVWVMNGRSPRIGPESSAGGALEDQSRVNRTWAVLQSSIAI
jgi:hypothetical protein